MPKKQKSTPSPCAPRTRISSPRGRGSSVQFSIRVVVRLGRAHFRTPLGDVRPGFRQCGTDSDAAKSDCQVILCIVPAQRCAKRAVHSLGYHRVQLTDSVNHSRIKRFGAAHCHSWARDGLERPRFFLACAPKKVFGVVPSHTRGRKVSTMQMPAISIP
jgi:hypothetical protein